LYVFSGLSVGGNAFFRGSLSILKNLKVIGNLTVGGNQGITGNYTDGNCWTAYSGGIIYGTNCTSL
jgi:hypothetical protein